MWGHKDKDREEAQKDKMKHELSRELKAHLSQQHLFHFTDQTVPTQWHRYNYPSFSLLSDVFSKRVGVFNTSDVNWTHFFFFFLVMVVVPTLIKYKARGHFTGWIYWWLFPLYRLCGFANKNRWPRNWELCRSPYVSAWRFLHKKALIYSWTTLLFHWVILSVCPSVDKPVLIL